MPPNNQVVEIDHNEFLVDLDPAVVWLEDALCKEFAELRKWNERSSTARPYPIRRHLQKEKTRRLAAWNTDYEQRVLPNS